MGNKLNEHPEDFFSRDNFVLFDEFNYFIDADLWTILDADTSGAVTHEGPGRSRVSVLASVDNEEAALVTTNELFKFVANKPLVCEALVQYSETPSDSASVLFGFADAIGANQVVDGGQSIAINDSGAVLWKKAEGSVWNFSTNIAGGTIETTASTKDCTTGDPQTLRIECTPISATVFQCRPFVDGAQLEDANGKLIQHDITLGTSTDMDLGAYVKGGHADDIELFVDYIYASQRR